MARRRIAGLGHRARSLGWWIAVGFMVGSFLFALGSFPTYANAVDGRVVAGTFFLGSLFFTAAGYLQFVQVIEAGEGAEQPRKVRLFAWQPDRIDWWAASVQSVGTLLFNVSTFAALLASLTVQQQDRLIWAPDLFGSIAFMIASSLAWAEVCHRLWAFRPHDAEWWIVAMNLGGSIAFQISAIAAFVRPADGELVSLPISNLGTFVGAVGFFVGATLLFPEMRAASEAARKS
jgi:hypothetical protein